MTKVYLSLGSNIGNREKNLTTAIQKLESNGIQITKKSSLYQSEPWGEKDQQWFLNQCLAIETTFSPKNLYTIIEQIEQEIGKQKTSKYGPRKIDIDILFYDQLIINNAQLTIPHPQIKNRQFVLQPLSQIAANFIHPLDNKTIKELQSECQDTSKIKAYES